MSLIQIGNGHVHHSRRQPCENSFRYPSFFLYFRCDQQVELTKILRSQFKNSLSFAAKDYLNGADRPVDLAIKDFLNHCCRYQADEVWLHTLPRMLGYAFNPVNFWLCRKNGALDAVLVEVNNTFGERHFYWVHPPAPVNPNQWYRAEKVFHVSPFFPVEGYYQIRFQSDDQQLRVDINYHGPDGLLRLATWVTGQLSELRQQSVRKIFLRYGWMTALVVFRIHYQALKLWFKKARFYRKPSLPKDQVSL